MPDEVAADKVAQKIVPHNSCVAHLHIMNQEQVRNDLGKKWSQIVPILEVQIGKIIRSVLPGNDLVFRKQALSYYVICVGHDFAEARCLLEGVAATIYNRVFGQDQALDGLQIILSAYSKTLLDFSDTDALKAELFDKDDKDGWSTIVDRNNAASFQPEAIENKILRRIVGMRSACDHLISRLYPLPESDSELANHGTALKRIASVSRKLDWSITRLLDGSDAAGPEPSQTEQEEAPVSQKTVEVPADIQPPKAPAQPAPKIAMSELESKETALFKDREASIGSDTDFAYFPIWNVKAQLVNSYRCGIVRHLPSGDIELNTGTETDVAAYKIDRLVQRKLALDLRDGGLDQDESTFVLPLHINTLQSPEHFRRLELALKSLSLAERKKLEIEIIGATPNTLLKTVQKAIVQIKIYCVAIGYRVQATELITENVRKIGVTHVGFHLEDMKLAGKNAVREIEALGRQAEALDLESYVMGVHSVADAAVSIGAGIKFIGGRAVGNELDMPWGTLPFEVESLYSRLLSS